MLALSIRSARRLRAACLLGCVALAVIAPGRALARTAGRGPARAAAVSLAVPSPGDVSYAMVRVHLRPGVRLRLPSGLTAQPTVFAQPIGGLAVRARAGQWRSLRATTRVYAAVAAVPGAATSERDLAIFVVRRAGHRPPANAHVTVTVANAGALAGSFWVHGVNRAGYANVFHVRNLLSTALTNWHRYTLALRAADALRAAADPLVRALAATASSAPRAGSGPWTGGQRADAAVRNIYHLLLGALHDPTSYGALKHNAAVPAFIVGELHNPSLAARWRKVVANVPVTVPDRYAAMAGEERQFTRVVAPRLSRARVIIADSSNAATEAATDVNGSSLQYLVVHNPDVTSRYGGTVIVGDSDASENTVTIQTCDVVQCSFAYPARVTQSLSLEGVASGDAAFFGWDGCVPDTGTDGQLFCNATLNGGETDVTAHFALGMTLTIDAPPSGAIINQPYDIDCPYDCSATVAVGATIVLTAKPAPGSSEALWTGCDQSTATSCTVTMSGDRAVHERFGFHLTVATSNAAAGSGGTVTGGSGTIDCGQVPAGVQPVCSADPDVNQTIVLTAAPAAGSSFLSWTGCPQASGTTCTVPMNQAQSVTASFGPAAPTTYPLSVTYATNNPAHTGYVTSSPAGIECGAVPSGDTSTCTASFSAGQQVTLTAVPNGGGFDSWTGCDSTSGYTCRVGVDRARSVTATFG